MTRQREHDRRRRENGWRRVDVWLDPGLHSELELMSMHKGVSIQEAIRAALRDAAVRA